ncbi:endonuclease/exonuclease/phosphatase family protein [Sphingobacterium sp. CZ-2]|uniref:endonuclease/exonuclease/phosphatase family protein n=1 Tax=Sphingobacterium sp. CZ-2 TaxID=2557994 RepID=UPI001FD67342|nr:endonuclease/exonuclease/phosphatase family protein [Sphingobacterium sp. CZ-2]
MKRSKNKLGILLLDSLLLMGCSILLVFVLGACKDGVALPNPEIKDKEDQTEKPAGKNKLILMTYNIHHGAPAPDVSNTVNLNNIAAVIRQSKAEVVALQELDVNVARSGRKHQARELGKMLNMHYYFVKTIDYRGGEYGIGILSKYPLTNKRRFFMPSPSKGEPRAVALATVNLPGNKKLEFGATHFDLNVPNRTAQANYLNQLSRRLKKPLIIGGDYNAESASVEMRKLQEEFVLSCKNGCPLSFPVRRPRKAIDLLASNGLANKALPLLTAVAINGQYASDHLPVIGIYQY